MKLIARLCVAAAAALGPLVAGRALAQEFRDECAFRRALESGARDATMDTLVHQAVLTTQYPGLDFGGTARVWDVARFPQGGGLHTRPNVALNFGASPIVMLFSPAVRGVGLYNSSLVDRERARFFDAGGALLHEAELPEAVVNFVGFLAPTATISRVEVVGIPPTNGTIYVDTIVYGDPAPCYADCEPTCTFVLDIFDFLCFQNRFAQNDPYACDCDTGSGPLVCDIFDFLCFQNAFAAGCP